MLNKLNTGTNATTELTTSEPKAKKLRSLDATQRNFVDQRQYLSLLKHQGVSIGDSDWDIKSSLSSEGGQVEAAVAFSHEGKNFEFSTGQDPPTKKKKEAMQLIAKKICKQFGYIE